MTRLSTIVTTASLLGLSVISPLAMAEPFDTVILNGRVIDPETAFDAVANVGIKDNQISVITQAPIEGKVTIDAAGKVVAPGFIDVHAHGQNIGDYRMQAMQGVTTMLELESGVLPIGDWYSAQGKKGLPLNYGAAAGWTYARIATFSQTPAQATAAYFQQAQSRNDWKMNIATREQEGNILRLIEQGLDEGGLGIGINAGYAPGYGQKEYYALAELAAKHKVATYTHVRYASNTEPQSSFEAVKELIGNAAITGAHMHICHINSTSLKDIETILPMVDQAKARGINISVGAYPYGAASTVVGAAMFQGGDWRERMGSTANNFQLARDRMTEAQLADYQKNNPGTFIVWHFLDEDNPADRAKLDASILDKNVLIESDEMFWMHMDEKGHVENYAGDEWPLPKDLFSHPRSNGAFAKVLRVYVRERGLLTLPEALRKMTLMPAQLLEEFVPQMKLKGRMQPKMDADIVVFDPKTIADKGTYQDPNHPAVGVSWLLVNGQIVVNNSQLDTRIKAGRAIRREPR